jgi:Xaa-Pro aminopeptidase
MNTAFFKSNRERLAKACAGEVIVLTAYTQTQRSGDAAFGFEQEANFWWLTGVNEPDWQLLFDTKTYKSWLVAPAVDDVHVIFDGGLAPDIAIEQSGVDGVLTQPEAKAKLIKYARQGTTIATLGRDNHADHYNFALNPAPVKLHRALKRQFSEVLDIRPALAKLRAIKQSTEIAAIQSAIDITIDAFTDVRQRLESFDSEYAVEAEFSYYFRRHGATGHAYDPIVAAGDHACTLHYDTNGSVLKSGELLLLDIGARHQGYAADITRTYAIGMPTARQAAVHRAVQQAQRQIIALIAPGESVKRYLESADDIMKQALSSLGLMDTPAAFRRYFPHAVSHGLGVDVHDSLGAPEVFVPGMVLTVEPGVYIPEEAIGVRIEDDILVTATGNRNLSSRLSTDL